MGKRRESLSGKRREVQPAPTHDIHAAANQVASVESSSIEQRRRELFSEKGVRSGKGPPSPQRPLSRQAKKKKKDHPQNRYRIETVAGAAVPGQEPANVDFQRQLGSYARKLIAFFTWYPRTTPESPMTGRTETWFDDHPEREQIAAVLI